MHWIYPNNIGLSLKFGRMWFVPPTNEITNNVSFLNKCSGVGYVTNKCKPGSIEVPVISIDEYIRDKEINNISLIKMDIEGEEYNTLIGAKGTIEKFRPILAIEYNRPTALRAGSSVEQIDELLEIYNYNRYFFSDGFHGFDLKKFNDPELVMNVYCFTK
jgi:hypothetical protein